MRYLLILLFLIINYCYSHQDNLQYYLNEAHRLKAAGNYDKVIEIYNNLLKREDIHIHQLINIYFELAQIYRLKHEIEKIEPLYNSAITKIKNELAKREDIFLMQKLAEIYEQLNKLTEAEIIYDKILQKNPHYIHILHKLCNIWQNKNILDKKLAEYTKRLKNEPSSENFTLVAEIYLFIKDYDNAIATYNAAVEKYPNHIAFYQKLAQLLKQQRRYTEAIKAYNKILEINPTYEFVYYSLADIYSEMGDRNNAISYYKKAYKFNKDDLNSCKNLGNILFNKTWYEEALKIYITCRKNLPILCREIADCYLYLLNYNKAIDEYINYIIHENGDIYYVKHKLVDELIENNASHLLVNKLIPYKNNEKLLTLLCYVYIAEGNYQSAIHSILSGKIENKHNLLFQLAHHLKGKDETSALVFYDAIEKNFGQFPIIDQAKLEKIRILVNQNKVDTALDIINTMKKRTHEIIYLEAIAHKKNKNYAKAIELFEQLIRDNYLRTQLEEEVADCYYHNSEYEIALQRYKKISKIDYSLFMQANCLYYTKKFDAALHLYKKLIDEYPHSEYVNDALYKFNFIKNNNEKLLSRYVDAEILIKKGDYNKAKAIATNIRSDYALYLLWYIYYNLLNNKSAAKIYSDQLLKNYPESLYILLINEQLEWK